MTMLILRALLALTVLQILPFVATAAQDEAYGTVTNVLDGDTFDVAIEKADSRINSRVERIRLADVDSPEMDTEQGTAARDFAYAVLMNKRVFLDIDDRSENGRDPYGRLVCVAYLTGVYGQPLIAPSFNQMLVSSGHASINDFTDNEFSLKEGGLPEKMLNGQQVDNISGQLESLKSDLISQLRDALAKELDKIANEAVDRLRG